MATRKRKPAIESGQGHSYGDFTGYDSINYGESVELSKILNRRGHTLTSKPNKGKSATDHEMMLDSLIDVNQAASRSYAKHQKNAKKWVPKKNVKRRAK
jgi:hypothetical protein